MENVKTEVKDGKLTIEIDMSVTLGDSKSGKTELIASTQGNTQVAPGVFLGLNLYKYKTAKRSA